MEREGKSLKVLFVCAGSKTRGICPIVSAQGDSLQEAGIDVDYFTIGGNGFHAYLKAIFRLRNYLKTVKYDIIHAHYGLSAVIALLSSGETPLVVSFMGDDLLGSNSINGRVTMWSRVLIKLNIFFARYFYDFVIVKSDEMLERLHPKTRSEVIPNGVNLNVFYPMNRLDAISKTGFHKYESNFLFVSDITRPEKNYNLALKSVRLVNPNAKIHVLKNKKPSELCIYFNAADALLITSYHEGSPNVVKEAMACNCPVVSTDVGDVKMLSTGVRGHFITSYNPKDISENLISALNFRSVIGETMGRHRIMELKLDSTTIAKRIAGIYHKCISKNQ